MDRIDQLMERINKNLADYHSHIKEFDKQEIIDMAGMLNAMSDAHYYLTVDHVFTNAQAEYLLQFENPLEIVADKWAVRTADLSDIGIDLDKIFLDRSAETEGYALAGADDSLANTSFIMPAIADGQMTDDMFSEKMQQLFPAGNSDALSKMMSYAAYIDDGEYSTTQFYLETAAEFTLVKRLYGEDIGTKLFDIAEENCLKPHEIRVAANLLNSGTDLDTIIDETFAGKLERTPDEFLESIQMARELIAEIEQGGIRVERTKPTPLDRGLAEHEFIKGINALLPDNSTVAMTHWINHARSLAFDGKQDEMQFLDALTAALADAKQLCGEEIATLVFHVAFEMPIPVTDIPGAALHLHNGGDINDIIDLSLKGQLAPVPEITPPARSVQAKEAQVPNAAQPSTSLKDTLAQAQQEVAAQNRQNDQREGKKTDRGER